MPNHYEHHVRTGNCADKRNRALNGTKWPTSLARKMSFFREPPQKWWKYQGIMNTAEKVGGKPKQKQNSRNLLCKLCRMQRPAATSVPCSSAIRMLLTGCVCFVLLTDSRTCLSNTKHLKTQHTNGGGTRYYVSPK